MTPANLLGTTVKRAAAWNKNDPLILTPYIFVMVLWASTSTVEAQGGLTLSSLGSLVPQNTQLNASHQPTLDYIGLPLISGPVFHVNNKFGFGQAFDKTRNGRYRLNVEETLDQLARKNVFLTESRVPYISIGIKLAQPETALSFFINERIFAGVQYQQELVEALWNGTAILQGETVSLNKTVASSTYFREYGAGFRAPVGKRLLLGVRLKLLQGFFNVRSRPGMKASFYVHPETFVYDFHFKNAGINTAGISELNSAAYMASNPNKGVAVDLGLTWNKSRRFSFSAAINDAGFISWKSGPKTFQVADTTFSLESVEIEDARGFTAAIDDLENKFSPVRNHQPYTTYLAGRAVLSSTLLLNSNERLSLLLMNQLLVGKVQSSMSLAYSKRISDQFSLSGALVKLPQHWPRPGVAFVFRKRAVQLFVATDNLLGFFNVSKARILDLQFGLNLYGRVTKQTR